MIATHISAADVFGEMAGRRQADLTIFHDPKLKITPSKSFITILSILNAAVQAQITIEFG